MGFLNNLKNAKNKAMNQMEFKTKCPSCNKFSKFRNIDSSYTHGKFECTNCGYEYVKTS